MARDASIGVNLIGRDVSASKALKDVGSAADKVGKKMVDVSDKIIKGMAMAATATAAAAIKIGFDAVKAAVEDQKSVDLLAQSIRTSTGATVAQTKAVEDYITQQQKRLGLDDGALRSSLGTLVRATGSVTKAQTLQNDALNISAMTGKDVQTVSLALAKAYTGNYAALSRMGITIDKTALKSKDFNKIMEHLRTVSKGFADREASTLEGKMRKIKVAFDEAKESLGYQLMPYVTRFAEYVSTTLVPAVEKWLEANGPKIRKMIDDTIPKVQAFLDKLGAVASWAADHKEALMKIGKLIVAAVALVKIKATVDAAVAAIGLIATAWSGVATAATAAATAETAAAGGGVVATAGATAGTVAATATAGVATGGYLLWDYMGRMLDGMKAWGMDYLKGITGVRASGGPVSAGGTYLVGERGPELLHMGGNGTITPNHRLGGGGTTIIVHGDVYDGEKFAQRVQQAIRTTNRRSGRGD